MLLRILGLGLSMGLLAAAPTRAAAADNTDDAPKTQPNRHQHASELTTRPRPQSDGGPRGFMHRGTGGFGPTTRPDGFGRGFGPGRGGFGGGFAPGPRDNHDQNSGPMARGPWAHGPWGHGPGPGWNQEDGRSQDRSQEHRGFGMMRGRGGSETGPSTGPVSRPNFSRLRDFFARLRQRFLSPQNGRHQFAHRGPSPREFGQSRFRENRFGGHGGPWFGREHFGRPEFERGREFQGHDRFQDHRFGPPHRPGFGQMRMHGPQRGFGPMHGRSRGFGGWGQHGRSPMHGRFGMHRPNMHRHRMHGRSMHRGNMHRGFAPGREGRFGREGFGRFDRHMPPRGEFQRGHFDGQSFGGRDFRGGREEGRSGGRGEFRGGFEGRRFEQHSSARDWFLHDRFDRRGEDDRGFNRNRGFSSERDGREMERRGFGRFDDERPARGRGGYDRGGDAPEWGHFGADRGRGRGPGSGR